MVLNPPFQSVRIIRSLTLFMLIALAAAANGLSARSSLADETTPAEPKSKQKEESNDGLARFDSDEIPEDLERLKLSDKQQEQIKGVIHDYNRSIAKVWTQFRERYLRTIAVESSLLAAIEDNFTEPQRQHIREQRRKTAQHEKALTATDPQPDPKSSKTADPVEEAITGVGVSLSPEQEAHAEKIEEKYRYQLRALNREIQGLHARLLSLEADKLVSIEKLLTKEQLVELRSHRQNKPDASNASNQPARPVKAE